MYQAKQESPKVVFIGLKLACVRFLPQRTFNIFLNHELTGLSRESIGVHSVNLVECIKLTKKDSLKHLNVNAETQAILSQVPLLQPYKLKVMYTISNHRTKCGLKN